MVTDKRKVGITLAGDLHRRVQLLAAAEYRSVASWIAIAVREKLERDETATEETG